jgi:HEPN domain
MSVPARIDGFLRTADEDLQAAEALAKIGNRLAAFHVQQALEKVIKASLLKAGIEAGAEHHLDALLKKLPENDRTREALWPLRDYGVYATTFRYPTTTGRLVDAPPRAEIDEKVAFVRAYVGEFRTRLKQGRDAAREQARDRERDVDDDDGRGRRRR